ncbi:FeoA domain protein [Clostridium acetireducens DSM 10703]|jgi:ferrous iron transport protein A|uniref:FeoA domain protein n=1 Tax=Clostridium acetireducens DSM 10703 TaxID=1121290 RepID=A0A1E8EX14_9CLOT|nr:FeoA family protein [Clostridium acetireducens]OFI01538.1 FeoA domain protein [Clostridium acetireducens DSM 10703]
MKYLSLNNAKVGSKVKIIKILPKTSSKQRLLDLGIVEGTIIYVIRKSLWGDPTAYLIRDTCIALRKEESENILVKII